MPIAPYPPKLLCCQTCSWKSPTIKSDVLPGLSNCPKCGSSQIKIQEASSWDLVTEWFKK